jgi:DNA-directed RNA polymerase subunit M/transcription elongation factor TFIIS
MIKKIKCIKCRNIMVLLKQKGKKKAFICKNCFAVFTNFNS